jgi:DNA polymerase alpha-associated DNA helicase A
VFFACDDLEAYTNCLIRGSKFLKSWMAFLEENADLRYPDASELFNA